MPHLTIDHDGQPVDLAYLDEGKGKPVLLIHGFASTKEVNWVNTGWTRALTGAGFRVIAFDNRGHGQSAKFHEERDYTLEIMAADAAGLLKQLEIGSAHVIGYSMGARIAAMTAIAQNRMVNRLVLSGYGYRMVEGPDDWVDVRDALLAPEASQTMGARARQFRAFADQTGSDREALAACVAGLHQKTHVESLRGVGNPVLVAVGSQDDVAGSGENLAALFPNGEFFAIEGRDHMKAVGDRTHIAKVIEFLQRR